MELLCAQASDIGGRVLGFVAALFGREVQFGSTTIIEKCEPNFRFGSKAAISS